MRLTIRVRQREWGDEGAERELNEIAERRKHQRVKVNRSMIRDESSDCTEGHEGPVQCH